VVIFQKRPDASTEWQNTTVCTRQSSCRCDHYFGYTFGHHDCHAKELLEYLNSIQPKILILNGDIIDFWAGKKWTWRQAHTLVIKRILELAISGTIVYYVIGNHDEGLRKLPSVGLGNFNLCNRLFQYLLVSIVPRSILEAKVMPSPTRLHDGVTKAIRQEAYLVVPHPKPLYPAKGVFNPDAER
jgi:hypothetical protein